MSEQRWAMRVAEIAAAVGSIVFILSFAASLLLAFWQHYADRLAAWLVALGERQLELSRLRRMWGE